MRNGLINQPKGLVCEKIGYGVKTHPGWDDRGADILIVAIITIVPDLVVRRPLPVQRQFNAIS